MSWMPVFSPWRHGGWYVDNVRYPSGAVGCVSRNYPDRMWRIVCDSRPGDHVYPSRYHAALAERWLTEEIAGPARHADHLSDEEGHELLSRPRGHVASPAIGSVPARWPADQGRVSGRCAVCDEPIHAADITADWVHTS